MAIQRQNHYLDIFPIVIGHSLILTTLESYVALRQSNVNGCTTSRWKRSTHVQQQQKKYTRQIKKNKTIFFYQKKKNKISLQGGDCGRERDKIAFAY